MSTIRKWDGRQDLYDAYGYHNTYEVVAGTFCLPIGEEPPSDPEERANWQPVAVVVAHAPYRKREYTFSAEKKTAPPVLPTPQSAGNFVFTGGTIEFATPKSDFSGGSYNWSSAGRYSFVENCDPSVDNGFILGTPAFPLASQVANQAQFGSPPVPGPLAEAGSDVRVGVAQLNGQQSDISSPGFFYNSIAWYPPVFNDVLVNGEAAPV